MHILLMNSLFSAGYFRCKQSVDCNELKKTCLKVEFAYVLVSIII